MMKCFINLDQACWIQDPKGRMDDPLHKQGQHEETTLLETWLKVNNNVPGEKFYLQWQLVSEQRTIIYSTFLPIDTYCQNKALHKFWTFPGYCLYWHPGDYSVGRLPIDEPEPLFQRTQQKTIEPEHMKGHIRALYSLILLTNVAKPILELPIQLDIHQKIMFFVLGRAILSIQQCSPM